jgi:hypothetical protein
MRRSLFVLALCSLLFACSDSTGPGEDGKVAVRFEIARTPGSASVSPADALAAAPSAAQSIRLEGRNGALTLERIALIVDELELEGEGDACSTRGGRDDDDEDEDDGDGDRRECEFQARGFLLDLPLDGTGITVASDLIPNGTYDELEFKVADVEFDDDGRVIGMLAAEVRSLFPNWPSRASAMVQGVFEPAEGGAARPFQVFLDADLKVEMDLNPPLVITDDDASREIVVEVHPELWFRRFDGSVLDLSGLDFERTGWVVRLDPFGKGFRRGQDDD